MNKHLEERKAKIRTRYSLGKPQIMIMERRQLE